MLFLRRLPRSSVCSLALRHAVRPISSSSPLGSENHKSLVGNFARIDHSRTKRTNFPEAVFGEDKTPSEICKILKNMMDHSRSGSGDGIRPPILATRVREEMWNEIEDIAGGFDFKSKGFAMEYCNRAKIVQLRRIVDEVDEGCEGRIDSPSETRDRTIRRRKVAIVTAGTTDINIAEEANVVLKACNVETKCIYDCGVAGLHRIINALPELTDEEVGCVIVCAGMDGALPSVVAGLVRVPVIAVPTSVGYGASFNGVAALLTMLNSW